MTDGPMGDSIAPVQQLFPPSTLLEHACGGLPLARTGPVVDAAAELGELHAARYCDEGYRGFTGHRRRLIRRIDALTVTAAPVPRAGAPLHSMSVGAVVDQIAACCAVAFHAPLARVSMREAEDARAELGRLLGEYTDLIDEVAAGACRLPTFVSWRR